MTIENALTAEAPAQAREDASLGLALLARAFQHLPDAERPYRYSRPVQDRFEAIAYELVGLVEEGRIDVDTAAAASSDKRFRRFLATAVPEPKGG